MCTVSHAVRKDFASQFKLKKFLQVLKRSFKGFLRASRDEQYFIICLLLFHLLTFDGAFLVRFYDFSKRQNFLKLFLFVKRTSVSLIFAVSYFVFAYNGRMLLFPADNIKINRCIQFHCFLFLRQRIDSHPSSGDFTSFFMIE